MNPLWLILTLLILALGCLFLLLTFDVIAAPEAIEQILDPILEPVRSMVMDVPALKQLPVIGNADEKEPQQAQPVGEKMDWIEYLHRYANREKCNILHEYDCLKDGFQWETHIGIDGKVESYCSCKGKNQSDQEWCEEEVGIWLADEKRCSFTTIDMRVDVPEVIGDFTLADDCEFLSENWCNIVGGEFHKPLKEVPRLAYCICPEPNETLAEHCDRLEASLVIFEEDGIKTEECFDRWGPETEFKKWCQIMGGKYNVLEWKKHNDRMFPGVAECVGLDSDERRKSTLQACIRFHDAVNRTARSLPPEPGADTSYLEMTGMHNFTLYTSQFISIRITSPDGSTSIKSICSAENGTVRCPYPASSPVGSKLDILHEECEIFLGEIGKDGTRVDQTGQQPADAPSGGCPDSNKITAKSFKRHAGWVEFDLINEDGWEQSSMFGQLNDSSGAKWTSMECERDSSDKTRINCWSTDSGIGTKTGVGSFAFDENTFGAACGTSFDLDINFGSVSVGGGGECLPPCVWDDWDGHCSCP